MCIHMRYSPPEGSGFGGCVRPPGLPDRPVFVLILFDDFAMTGCCGGVVVVSAAVAAAISSFQTSSSS